MRLANPSNFVVDVLKPHRCKLNELRLKAPRTARRSHSAAFSGSVGLAT
jgi:hypothetical protein